MHIAEQQKTHSQNMSTTVLKHALAGSLVLNLVIGWMFWSATHEGRNEAEPLSASTTTSPDIFDFYTKALDSSRETIDLMQSVYCGNLSAADCSAKFDKDAHAKGGETLARYLARKEESVRRSDHPIKLDVKPLDYDALRQAGMLPK